MSSKMSNYHIRKLLETKNIKDRYILETYSALNCISTEFQNEFVIQCGTNTINNLVSILKKYLPVPNKKTIYNSVKKLIEIDFLRYSSEMNSWVLVDMHLAMEKQISPEEYEKLLELFKDDPEKIKQINSSYSMNYKRKGYTHIRDIFLSDEFSKLTFAEKRILMYCSLLSDSKSGKHYECFEVNLSKQDSQWFKVLRTNDKYYASSIMENFIKNNKDLVVDKSEEFRIETMNFYSYKEDSFKFSFKCSKAKLNPLKDAFGIILRKYKEDYSIILKKAERLKLNLKKLNKQESGEEGKIELHILRAVSCLKSRSLKERVTEIILNKYKKIQEGRDKDKQVSNLRNYLSQLIFNLTYQANDNKSEEITDYRDEYYKQNMKNVKALMGM